MAYNGRIFTGEAFRGAGELKRCDLKDYYVKGYDKARQYNLPESVFRWEYGTRKMRYLDQHNAPLTSLADLLDPRKLEPLGGILAELFDGLTLDDIPDPDRLTRTERKLYDQAANPRYWEALTNRKQRHYTRQRFDALRAKYGAREREQIAELIRRKWEALLLEKSDVFTGISEPEFGTFSPFTMVRQFLALEIMA